MIGVVFSALGANRRALVFPCALKRNQGRVLAFAFAIVLCSITLDGCGPTVSRGSMPVDVADSNFSTSARVRSRIPLPDRDLLKPASKPDCEFRDTKPAADNLKLNYERDCFRQSEIIVRNRLQALQHSVQRTIRAVRSNGLNGS